MNPTTHRTYQIDQIDRVPSATGIYCWMARPDFDEYSWRMQEGETASERTEYLADELSDFCKLSQLQEVKAQVTAFFDTKWDGYLGYAASRTTENAAIKALKSTCKSNAERRLMVDLISASFPVFWQPLYIGVAKDLRTRLATHKRIINADDSDDLGADDQGGSDAEDMRAARSLGERLKACSFRPEQLSIHTIIIDNAKTDVEQDQIRKIAEMAESWLNLYNTPKMGKS